VADRASNPPIGDGRGTKGENPTIQAAYIDDEEPLLEVAKAFLEDEGGLRVDVFGVVWDAFSALNQRPYDVIVCDYQMPEMDGLQVLRVLRENGSHVPFILFTGKGREEVAIEALNLGADRYIQKGGDPKAQFVELKHAVVQLHQRIKVESELHESNRELEVLYHATRELVGEHDLHQMGHTIFKAISDAIPADTIIVSSFDGKSNALHTEAAWLNGKMVEASLFPATTLEEEGHGIQSLVIRSGNPLIIPDYQALLRASRSGHRPDEPSCPQNPIPEELTEQSRSAIIVPMKRDDQVIGVLSVMSNERAAFSERHLRFLEPLAGSAAAAISLSRMHHETVVKLDRREQAEHQRSLMKGMIDACENGIMIWRLAYQTEDFLPVLWNPASARMLFGQEGETFSNLKDCSRSLNLDLNGLALEANRTLNQVKVLAVREGSDQQLIEVIMIPLDVEHVGLLIMPK
jgi:CheY-like chemotaxis protein